MIEVRRAGPDDAEAMVGFLRALHDDAPDTLGRRDVPTVEAERQSIEKAHAAERAFLLIAIEVDEIVGLLDVFAWERPEGRHCGRLGISVLKGRRDRGVGRQLMQRAIAEAKAWDGFCRLELEVVAWNDRAIHLYRSLGFEVEGRRRRAINLRGANEDILCMGLVWDPAVVAG